MLLIVLAGLAVAAGALVQGTIGFGMGLIAVPLLAILDPTLVPVPALVIGATHALLTLGREHSDTDWRGVGWTMLGRLPGTALGVLAVALAPEREFTVVVALAVLLCAGLSTLRWRLRPSPPALVAAGLVGGASGTASSIGGPPVALVYQHESGARVRSTLAAYFTIGALLSLLSLGAAHQVSFEALLRGVLLLPFMVAGFAVSGPLRRLFDHGWTRPAVVALAAVSALGLLGRALLG